MIGEFELTACIRDAVEEMYWKISLVSQPYSKKIADRPKEKLS
jgi:hypothetical protein